MQNVEDDELLLALAHIENDKNKSEQEQESAAVSASVDIPTESVQSEATTTKKRPSITPSASTSEIVTAKKTKITENIDQQTDEDLPRFLSRTNDIFKSFVINKRIPSHSINIEQLRTIALFKFYISLNNLDIKLWTAYLQSGTGQIHEQLKEQPSKPEPQAAPTTTRSKLRRWPSDLKDKMIKSGFISADANERITDDNYQNFVYQQIRRCRDKNSDCQNELKEVKKNLNNSFTPEINETIDKFVDQYGTSFHRVPINRQISAIEYKYQDRLFELDFFEENPRDNQLEVFRTLSKLKYEKETAKMVVAILKQRLVYNHLPSSFESLHIPEPISLHTIESDTIRQRLSEQYHKVLQRTKSDMLHVYITTEQAKADQCTNRFNEYYEEIKENQRHGSKDIKLTSTMWHLLQRRLANINKHIIHLYNLKIDFFAKAPTVKN